jgi:hypothetical protein
MREQHGDPKNPHMEIAPMVLEAIRERGPLSSIDFKESDTVHWSWGQKSRLTRASLDVLYAMGEIHIHHRVGSRRVYDLTERLISAKIISSPDPNETMEDYQDWHVLRRVGGMGIAGASTADFSKAMLDVKGDILRSTLVRLVEREELVVVAVEGVPNRIFFIRTQDLPTLELARTQRAPKARASLLGALDNALWDRNLLRWLFGFDFVWEVYKPVKARKYGYYVLPILYGDRFIARADPIYEKTENILILKNWWWETEVQPDDRMKAALKTCMKDFMRYLGTSLIQLGDEASRKDDMEWLSDLNLG